MINRLTLWVFAVEVSMTNPNQAATIGLCYTEGYYQEEFAI